MNRSSAHRLGSQAIFVYMIISFLMYHIHSIGLCMLLIEATLFNEK